MDTILEVEGLCKTYGKTEVLKGLDFKVGMGEVISVLGPSGCGKSTLLQIIAGLQQPDAGTVRLHGEVVSSKSHLLLPEKRNINMVFQDFALWPHMDVLKNISYGLRRQKLPSSEIGTRVEEVVELLHLNGLERRLPSQLSGGQQQRVAIARALATRPSILLLDEPLSNLDVQLRIEMRTEMAYLFRKLGTTVFHVTHDPTEAFALANRLIIMRVGAIDQIATPQECFERPSSALVAALLGAGNSLSGKEGRDATEFVIGEDCLTGLFSGSGGAHCQSLEARFRPDDVLWSFEAAGNCFGAEVVHSTFEGKHYRILANTVEGQKVSFLHQQSLETGAKGFVHLEKSKLFLYRVQDLTTEQAS